MDELAVRASMRGRLDIMEIMVFEGLAPRGAGYRPRLYDPNLKWYYLPWIW